MGSFIIKPVRERDFYIEYSTIVDSWTLAGTREEMLAEGTDPRRLDRADLHGTSAHTGWYNYAKRAESPSLLFHDVMGDRCGSYEITYENIEAWIKEEYYSGAQDGSAEQRAIYDKYGTKWEPWKDEEAE